RRLETGKKLLEEIAERTGRPPLPVEFRCMSAEALELPAGSVDFILADNVFEHFDDPRAVLVEARRVLRDGGLLAIPIFSSILSKHGLHLKHGLRLPWLNLVFSERTIVDALAWRARRHPELYTMYPGLEGQPQRVRDVRRHRDLNDLTYAEFRRLAAETGFKLRYFKILPTLTGLFLQRIPGLRETRLGDIFSLGASALLVAAPRPGEAA
ncbi:MAG: class I SAM-dependent methyltransferase, partial [Acidobacteria bacterium]|nr:class I SAM-dependent methyltransferase [Acidobacteriota bacterium]